MPGFDFDQEQILTFFAVLVRYGTLVAVVPFLGDKTIPAPTKVLLALVITTILFPVLVSRGYVKPGEAIAWASTAGGIIRVVGLEALCGLILGFTARLVFDAVQFGSNLSGTFMGFAMASQYDHHQESQSQVVAEFFMAITMLLFLSLNGHHLLLRGALESYSTVGLGRVELGGAFGEKLLELTGHVFRLGIQMSAPLAISIFSVNVAMGVVARAMPQFNVMMLSFSVTAILGIFVIWLGMGEFQGVATEILGKSYEWMREILFSVRGG